MFCLLYIIQKPELDFWDKQIQNQISKAAVECVSATMTTILKEIYHRAIPYFNGIAQAIYRETGPLQKYCDKYGVSAGECKRYVNSNEVATTEQLITLAPTPRSLHPEIKKIFQKIKLEVNMESDFPVQSAESERDKALAQYLAPGGPPDTAGMIVEETTPVDTPLDIEQQPTSSQQQPRQHQQPRPRQRREKIYSPRYSDYEGDSDYEGYSDYARYSDYESDPNRNIRRRRREPHRGRRETERERRREPHRGRRREHTPRRERRKRRYEELELPPKAPPTKKSKKDDKGEMDEDEEDEEETTPKTKTKTKTKPKKKNPHAVTAGTVKHIIGVPVTVPKASDDWRQEKIRCPLKSTYRCPDVGRVNFPKHWWQHVIRKEHTGVELKEGTTFKFGAYGVRCNKGCTFKKSGLERLVCPTSGNAWARHLMQGCGGGPEKPEEQAEFPGWAKEMPDKAAAEKWLAKKAKKKKEAEEQKEDEEEAEDQEEEEE